VIRRAVKPLVRRARSDRDVNDAIEYYKTESPAAARGFVDALESAYQHVQRWPATGSSRYAFELNLPGVRFWPCRKYPYLVFYFEKADCIEIWRVLHALRDIPRWLQDGDDPEPIAG
jgi:toxin ParE1/3/4